MRQEKFLPILNGFSKVEIVSLDLLSFHDGPNVSLADSHSFCHYKNCTFLSHFSPYGTFVLDE
jgi:hypothetical protein